MQHENIDYYCYYNNNYIFYTITDCLKSRRVTSISQFTNLTEENDFFYSTIL